MQWLERWVRPKGREWRPMMFGGAVIALNLAIIAALGALYAVFLVVTGSTDALGNPLAALIIATALAGVSWFLFRVYKVYLRIAKDPDPNQFFEREQETKS